MRFLKPVAAAMALSVAALSFASSAEAGHRYRHHRHHGGDAAAAGIIGFAAGAILGGALSQPRYRTYRYYEPAPVYVEPPVVYQPAPTYYQRPAPWTPEWYAYCDARYVSFNPANGLFRGFDGQYHFCR
jgi:hypothetical protein